MTRPEVAAGARRNREQLQPASVVAQPRGARRATPRPADRVVARRAVARQVRAHSVRAVVLVRLTDNLDASCFEERLRALNEVAGAVVLAGDHDLLIWVECPDLFGLDGVIRRLRAAGASQTCTQLVLRTAAGFGAAGLGSTGGTGPTESTGTGRR